MSLNFSSYSAKSSALVDSSERPVESSGRPIEIVQDFV